jgi:ADP-ribosylglycohydrolase
MKKQFIDSSVRVLSKGFNTDTNASIALGMVGAIIGYNNIPSFFKSKILNAASTPRKNRVKDYSSQMVI